MLNKSEWVNIRFLAKGKKIATKTFSLLPEVYGEDNELYFDVLLTVHLSIILVINQLNAQILVL